MDLAEDQILSADQDSEIRCEEFLRVKIGEAKNLSPRNGFVRDVFCTVNLDREEIFRTSVAEKTLCPFFAEEFHFEVPRRFRHLAFYVCDKENKTGPGKALGKVAIRREDLNKYNGKDHWMPVYAVNEDSEVEGKIHLSIKIDHVISSKTGLMTEKLAVRVIECSELTVVSGSCHPFAVVTLTNHKDRVETKRTKTKRKTASPLFDETFHFNLEQQGLSRSRNAICSAPDPAGISGCEIRISLQHETGAGFSSTFLGEVRIPLQGIDLEKGYKCWHMLQAREAEQATVRPGMGSLRLKIQFTSDYVLSSRYYEPLKSALLRSTECKPISSSAAFILGEMAGNKIDAAQPLVKLFARSSRVLPLIRSLAEWEIARVTDPNTIFRGNTLLSKFLDELMKLIGSQYLHETLRYVIHRVIREKKSCEIDPTRIRDGQSLEENMSNLTLYLDLVFKSIITSVMMCPQLMRDAFAILKELSQKYFREREVSYSVISGFIFLRFFAPAILNPKLFDITDQVVDLTVARTLTLMSKTVQMLGNLVSSKLYGFSIQSPQIFKEDYMTTLQKRFITDHYIENTRVFLELISSPNSVPRMNDRPMTLKEGVLLKRVVGKGIKFGGLTFNKFKRRHFCLTTQNLFYAKSKHKPISWNLPVSDIRAVEKLREDSFKMKNMFQIMFNEKALYIKANNCVEEKEWIDILTRICISNQNRLKDYHPSAFIGNQWLCCRQMTETANGCCPVSKNLPSDIAVHVDPDREVARIHSLLFNHMETIDDLLLRTSTDLRDKDLKGDATKTAPSILIEDRKTFHSTLRDLKAILTKLDADQKSFLQKEWNETIYGSEKAPIGDTAYLCMIAQHAMNEPKSGDQIESNNTL